MLYMLNKSYLITNQKLFDYEFWDLLKTKFCDLILPSVSQAMESFLRVLLREY